MTFNFGIFIANVAKTRNVGAGSIISSGTASNRDEGGGPGKPVSDGGFGYSCIAELRMVETIHHGKPSSEFLKYGDVVRISMADDQDQSIFGAIEQSVVQASSPGRP